MVLTKDSEIDLGRRDALKAIGAGILAASEGVSVSAGATAQPAARPHLMLAGDENGLLASTTNITSACRSVLPAL